MQYHRASCTTCRTHSPLQALEPLMPSTLDCKVYVGDLGSGASKQELEEAFSYYGPLRNVWVARKPPGFAFVEFEDMRDAKDAVRGLDERTICGRRVRVELSTGKSRNRFRGPQSRRGRPFHPDDRCYECGKRGHYARDCHRLRSRSRTPRKRRSYTRPRDRSHVMLRWQQEEELSLKSRTHIKEGQLLSRIHYLQRGGRGESPEDTGGTQEVIMLPSCHAKNHQEIEILI